MTPRNYPNQTNSMDICLLKIILAGKNRVPYMVAWTHSPNVSLFVLPVLLVVARPEWSWVAGYPGHPALCVDVAPQVHSFLLDIFVSKLQHITIRKESLKLTPHAYLFLQETLNCTIHSLIYWMVSHNLSLVCSSFVPIYDIRVAHVNICINATRIVPIEKMM